VRVWVEDFKYHLTMALRSVGIGIVAIAWASALTSEAQQVTDTRAYIQVAAACVCMLIVQALTQLPPSWTGKDLLKPLERDITAVARERAAGDAALQAAYAATIRDLAITRIRQGANVPRDRRGWARALLRLAEANQTRDDLQVNQAGDA
jgi:hypothetical protein